MTPRRTLYGALVVVLVMMHLETALPDALRPLQRPEMARLPAPLAFLRGVPSPQRAFFAKPTAEPSILVVKAIGVALLVAWAACALLLPPSPARRAASWALAALLVLALYVVPAAVPIVARLRSGDPALAHDGGTIQIEEAAKMLLAGKNPYTESYRGTPLEKWRGLETPIVDHFPYYPWAVLPLVPAVALLQAVGLPDLRLLYLLLAFATAALLAWPERDDDARQALALLPFFSPLLAKASILGTNDLFAIFWIACALLLLERGALRAGMVVLGLAMACKQFAWALYPLALAYVPEQARRLRATWILAPATLAAVALPFVLWDPASFVDDTFGYALGGSATAHPIKGVGSYGFGTLALAYGLVPDANAPFPESLLGAQLALAVLAAAAARVRRTRAMGDLLAGFALALLPFLYFARYMHGNFLAFALLFLLCGCCRGAGDDGPDRSRIGSP